MTVTYKEVCSNAELEGWFRRWEFEVQNGSEKTFAEAMEEYLELPF